MATADSPEGSILLAIDDPKAVEAYATALGEHWHVRGVRRGQDALVATDDNDVDVIVIQRRLEDLSADAVLNELRVRGMLPKTVVLTGREPTVEPERMGFDACHCMPVSPAVLCRSVETQLEARLKEARAEELDRPSGELEAFEPEEENADLLIGG